MKQRCLALLMVLALLSSCSGVQTDADHNTALHILATTYPVYLFTTAVTEGVEGVSVELLVQEQISCLHDYTLTVTDMKAIEKADIIVMNGAGLEEFMTSALRASDAPVIDSAFHVSLLPAVEEGPHDHEEDEAWDPHLWLDPVRAAAMTEEIGEGLSQADPEHAAAYRENAVAASAALVQLWDTLKGEAKDLRASRTLITFHDGFQYFAHAFDLTLLKAIEEEEGAETSAAELKEITHLIGEYHIPAIFTEKNGSEATARALERETGCAVFRLDMMMSGEGDGLEPYVTALTENVRTVIQALGEEEASAP